MYSRASINYWDLVSCLSQAADLIAPEVVNHHYQVSYISLCLGETMGLSRQRRNRLAFAGALHDIGGLTRDSRLICLDFEAGDADMHAWFGYALLNKFKPFAEMANLVRYHHTYWEDGKGAQSMGREVPLDSHALHLSDRVAILVRPDQEILGQVPAICQRIKDRTGRMFNPQMVEAFLEAATRESFWLDLVSGQLREKIASKLNPDLAEVSEDQLQDLSKLFSQLIDFRSSFTASHSSGVAACAEAIAGHLGFSQKERSLMKVAGYLHDLGKLAVPKEILEKPGKLEENEFNVVRCHTYHTFNILDNLPAMDMVKAWGALHHERMDGKGYPFKINGANLSLGSRIMSVSDIYTALMEDRPYRQGMDGKKALGILWDMVGDGALAPEIVSILEKNYDDINSLRITAQKTSKKQYQQFFEMAKFSFAGQS